MSLLDEALEAHGGAERWRARQEVRAGVRSGGFALGSKLAGRRFRDYRVTVALDRVHALLEPYPRAGRRGIFDGDSVRIESDDGEVLAERSDPRSVFRLRSRRALWWDALDSLYFAGYAMWNYLNTPLLLTRSDVRTREGEPWEEAPGETWRRLHATFPDGLPTHSREQTFYFGEDGLLRRHDYTAEVFGPWARAAHRCWDHASFDGLVVATRRKVTPRRRSNRPAAAPTLVWIELSPA